MLKSFFAWKVFIKLQEQVLEGIVSGPRVQPQVPNYCPRPSNFLEFNLFKACKMVT